LCHKNTKRNAGGCVEKNQTGGFAVLKGCRKERTAERGGRPDDAKGRRKSNGELFFVVARDIEKFAAEIMSSKDAVREKQE